MRAEYTEFTRVLQEWELGDDEALDRLIPEIYEALKHRALGIFKEEMGEGILQATALVNELYLRLAEGNRIQFKSRTHFFVVATRMMRRILVEQARKRQTLKRGQNMNVTLDHIDDAYLFDPDTALAVDKALKKLEIDHPRTARVLELKIFGELENTEIAEALQISPATVKREWADAKRLMFLTLRGL
ncbi:MAG: ECF-type sigma factor [Acidobacteriota bacterium]|nr:ECF-type sigma factor [Acidobacteriota bacterium]